MHGTTRPCRARASHIAVRDAFRPKEPRARGVQGEAGFCARGEKADFKVLLVNTRFEKFLVIALALS